MQQMCIPVFAATPAVVIALLAATAGTVVAIAYAARAGDRARVSEDAARAYREAFEAEHPEGAARLAEELW